MNEFSINEDDIEAFYASLDADSHFQDNNHPSNVSVWTRPSDETQKALLILSDLLSKEFFLLSHPGRSITLKDTLSYLLSLPPGEGFSLRTKSAILQLSSSFPQLSLDHDNAKLKLESATAYLSKAEKVEDDLHGNIKDFKETYKAEQFLCNKLASLQEEKRKLEEKIDAIKADIEDITAERETVAERKKELFRKGRVMKAESDDLRNKVPRLKAEQNWAKVTQHNVALEWTKLKKTYLEAQDPDN